MTGRRTARRSTCHHPLRLKFENFVWADETRCGFPLLFWSDGALCEPATGYFGYLCKKGKGQPGSLKDKAYIVRDWLTFLHGLEVLWYRVTDEHFRLWRERQRRERAVADGGTANFHRVGGAVRDRAMETSKKTKVSKRVAHKLSVIFEFYVAVRLLYRGHDALLPLLPMIGPETDMKRNITSKEILTAGGSTLVIWGNHVSAEATTPNRPTPTNDVVRRISEYLRSGTAKGRSADRVDYVHSERNWAMERCMSRANLRCCEVAQLSLVDIWDALPTRGLRKSLPSDAKAHPLDWIGDHDDLKQELLANLERIRRREPKTTLFIKVAGKGHMRVAPFPIDLVADLLEVVVWGARRSQIRSLATAHTGYSAPTALFISSKTGKPLTAGSIGGIIADAFSDLDLAGSAQRLRARAGVNFAVSLRFDKLSDPHFRVDQPWENYELEQLREWMGHAKVTVTLRFYVKLATAELELLKKVGTHRRKFCANDLLAGLSFEERSELSRALIKELSKEI